MGSIESDKECIILPVRKYEFDELINSVITTFTPELEILNKLNQLISGELKEFSGTASFGTLIKAFTLYDNKFNHAFMTGTGAAFDEKENLLNVDGFGLFKYSYYETHPILKKDGVTIVLKLTGRLTDDSFVISIISTK